MKKFVLVLGVLGIFVIIRNCNIFAEESQKAGKQFIIEQQKQKEEIRKNLPKLLEKLKTAKGERKWRLIQRIGYSEDPRVIEPLIKIVQSEKESMDNRKAALNSLAVTKDKGKAIPFLKQILNDENFKIQVARLLIDNGYGTGVEIGILETYAKQGHPDVLFDYKLISTKPMKSQVVYYKELDARNILMELTNHKDEEVRAKSVFYLLKDFNEKEFALSKLDEILNSENKQVREYGKGILRKIEDEKSKKKLQELEYQELQKELKNAEQKKDTKEDKK